MKAFIQIKPKLILVVIWFQFWKNRISLLFNTINNEYQTILNNDSSTVIIIGSNVHTN